MELISLQSVTAGYERKDVIRDVSLTVNEGEFLCIVGPNGGGKTTAVKVMLGLMRPRGGRVVLAPGLKRKDIGYLPQRPPVQRDFPATVKEVVYSGVTGRLLPFLGKAEKARVNEVVRLLDLADLMKESYRALSGGQQQRVLLARAVLAAGRVLVLDEPSAALDAEMTHTLYALLRDLRKKGLTVVLISHDAAARAYASRTVRIDGGVRFDGASADYKEEDYPREGGHDHANCY